MPGTDRVEIRTLKVGRFCVVDEEAYKILSISKSKPGKHGSAKARLELVSLFSSKKISKEIMKFMSPKEFQEFKNS